MHHCDRGSVAEVYRGSVAEVYRGSVAEVYRGSVAEVYRGSVAEVYRADLYHKYIARRTHLLKASLKLALLIFGDSPNFSLQGLPNKKILKIFLWGGHPARPQSRTGKDAHPTHMENLIFGSP
jgi:hypothetical protein